MKRTLIAVIAFLALAFSALTYAQGNDDDAPSYEEEGEAEYEVVVADAPEPSRVKPSRNDSRNGLHQLADGTCIKRLVLDNGHTNVTIDARGTLSPMKNDIVEDVMVPCP